VLWSIVPFGSHSIYTEVNLTILYIFAISSLSVYGIILSGWSSNSKYAFLGGLRSTAQMVSYEISIGMILMPLVLYTGSLNLLDIILKQGNMGLGYILPFFPLFMLFFISSLAETNRPPFDLPEAKICLGFFKDHYMPKLFMSLLTIKSARDQKLISSENLRDQTES
jgi:NADH-quinone oxidoreductase subunit H